jgi:hypothetical protein
MQVYEDDEEPKPLPEKETKKRIPLTTVSTETVSKNEAVSTNSEADASKAGRRVNLITLASPSDPKKK